MKDVEVLGFDYFYFIFCILFFGVDEVYLIVIYMCF